ncbi:putative arf gtpase activator [Golovinomyces cichoracearum]|uniref:ADP-ribosylation factor GTPase-activating protein n=1 Tax=Golovinomyces cichoracearum TaxID=62708 RepID=A0A420HV19_9PEZI|nr:putative arf gtpase activator [Golovinomyces cichoracearum]
MGNVSSRHDEASALYLRDQNRLTISSLLITNARRQTILHVVPNTFPATKFSGSREALDARLVEYVQDPESPPNFPTFILKLNNDDELTFKFSFIIRQTTVPESTTQLDTNINGLTYVSASTAKEVETLVTREFHADPNFHKNSNVQLVGDFSTGNSQSVSFDWSWKWRPPKSTEDRGGGWRNACSFVEYDQRAHRFDTLASFSFWVSSKKSTNSSFGSILTCATDQSSNPGHSNPTYGPFNIVPSMNFRVPSSQTTGSHRLSGTDMRDLDDPPSPKMVTTEDHPAPEPSLQKDLIKIDVSRQRLGKDMSETEDGPLFRATMKSLEQKTGNMRQRMKKVLKKAEAAHLAQIECNEAKSAFMEALREASLSNANAVQPALEHYFDKIAREILAYERQSSTNLQKIIIDPIMKVYNIDIKQAESKKRDFEEESKDYYAYVSRYLGQRQDSLKEKKRADSDSKYQIKRRNFELKRFDYSTFMQDLHGGRKEQEVLSHLTKYADAQTRGYLATAKKIEELLPHLDALSAKVQETDKEFQYQRTEREEKRRNLEKSNPTYTEPDIIIPSSTPVSSLLATSPISTAPPESELSRSDSTASQFRSTHQVGLVSLNTPNTGASQEFPRSPGCQYSHLSSSSSNAGNQTKFKGIRDLEEKDRSHVGEKSSTQRKEGLLWALSRPGSHSDPRGLNKQAWHKFWIVVDAGKVSEYNNWKQRLDLHREPIDLRVASVREARNAERRFCFEVITPHYKRVYQATSEEDMNNWISAINNAIQSAVEGRDFRDMPSTAPRQEPHSIRRDIGSILTGKSSSINHGSHHHCTNGGGQGVNSSVFRRTTIGARPAYSRKGSNGFDESPDKLLQLLRDADQSNCLCADCSSGIKTEWVSINLGIILCIECSGIHRSLGTHISKIRSLTLDLQSFTTDIVELLLLAGNRISNSVWEARLEPGDKPSPQATRETRLKFITAKYVDRIYVLPISSKLSRYSTADETLLTAIKRNEIQNVIYALALGASPNICDKSRGTHSVYLALAAADPASTSPASMISGSNSEKNVAFPIAEILIQNGAEIPSALPAFPLSRSACLYIEQKSWRSSLSVDTVGSLPNSNMSLGEKQIKERETRLQKRVSAGGRLAKAPIPEI